MQPTIRHDLFTQKTIDSASLGALASTIHQFGKPGFYSGQARQGETVAASFAFTVDEQSEVRQLSIDLSALTPGRSSSCCNCDEPGDRIVSPRGYVLFYASRGHDYSVLVGERDHGKAEFDSSRLARGDLFAVSLLEPTIYTVSDLISGGKADVTVKRDPACAKNIKSVKPVYVEVKQGSMEPAKIELASGQGLVFRIETDSRIVIKKMGPAREEDKRVLRRTFSSSSTAVPEGSRHRKGTAQGKSIGPNPAE